MGRLALELRHIPRSHFAGDMLPRVVALELPDSQYGGYYVSPRLGDHKLPNHTHVRADRGVIVLCSEHESTFTHELRHHWQAMRGLLPKAGSAFSFDGSTTDYWREIRRYFRTYWHEWDALRYEHRHCPTELNDHWLDVTMRSAA